MPKKVEEKIYILCPYRGYIAAAKIMGPIVHPLQVDKTVAIKMLMTGAEVHEYDPKTKETIKLTINSINDPKRFWNAKHPVTNGTPVNTVVKTGVQVGIPKVEKVTEPEPESTEPTIEETVQELETKEATQLVTFEYNEDGTVNENVINWSMYTKSQRKAIRAQITAHNASVATAEE